MPDRRAPRARVQPWGWLVVASLFALGAVSTLLGLALALNLLSLRLWLAGRLPALARPVVGVHAVIGHAGAQVMEGALAGLGIGLMALLLAICLIATGGRAAERAAGWGRRASRAIAWGVVAALIPLALSMPIVAERATPGLTSMSRLRAQWRSDVCIEVRSAAGTRTARLLRCPITAAARAEPDGTFR